MNTTSHFNAVYAHLVEGKKGVSSEGGGCGLGAMITALDNDWK